MGALYERYLAEQQQGQGEPGAPASSSLYDRYLAETGGEKPDVGFLDTAKDALRQTAKGLGQAGYSTAQGVVRLTRAVADHPKYVEGLPGGLGVIAQLLEPSDETIAAVDESRKEMEDFYGEPETTAGSVAHVAGRVAGEGAQFMLPGAALSKVGALPKVGFLGRMALNAALEAPLNAAKSQVPGESLADMAGIETENPLARAGLEIAGNAVAGAGLEVAGRGLARAASPLIERARGLTDFTEGIDDAFATGAREGTAPNFDMAPIQERGRTLQELLAGMEELQGKRAAVAAEEPSTTSQLLRAERGEQLSAAEKASRSLEIPAARQAAVRPIRDVLREFQEGRAAGAAREAARLEERAAQPAAIPSAASSLEESRLPLPGSVSATSDLSAGTQAVPVHSSATAFPSTSSRRTMAAPSSTEVGDARTFIVGSLDSGAPTRKLSESAPTGHAGTAMLSSLAGAGAGGLAGATQGDTPEERARNAALGALAGAAGGTAIAEGAARALRVSATGDAVAAAVRGAPTRQELGELLNQVRANPRKSVHYVVRDESGKAVGSGSNLAEFFADAERARGMRSGAIGTQPEGGAASPLRPNTTRERIPYEPGSAKTPSPVSNAEAAAGTQPLSVPPDLDPDDYFNFSRVLLDPGGEKRLREEVALVARARGLNPKQRIGWEETKKVAKSIGLHPEDLVTKGDVQRLTGAEMLAIRNIVKDNVDALERISQQLGSNANLTAAEREMLERQSAGLERQTDMLLAKFVKARSQTGRDLNNLKILAEGSLDSVTWNLKAKRMLGDEPFTDMHRAEILKLINAGDRAGLATYVAKLRRSTKSQQLVTLWKAGLLTGPPTHIANALGNTTMSALEVAKDVPATALDALFGAVTGQRTKDLSLSGAAAASLRGAKKGAKEAADILRGRVVGEGLGKYDLSREVDFDNAFLDKYTKLVFRSLTASDRIFKQAALTRSLSEQARVLAKSQKFIGAALEAEVERLTKFPTDEMVIRAIHDAEIATFQNRGVLGSMAAGARRAAASSPVLDVAANVVLPFTMTPANVASRVVEYSPLGAFSTIPDIVKLFRAAMPTGAKYDLQKKLVERLGRSAVGSLPILAGAMLAKAGRMTGGYPSEQSARDQWALDGRQENSVLVDGKWHSLERVSPLGNLVVFGAQLYNAFSEEGKSLADKAGAAGGALVRTVADQSFLTGLSGALDAVMDPKREGGRYLRNTAGSVVPNIVRRMARAVDPVVRDRASIADELRYRIPGMSKSLPARVDQFGRQLESEGSLAAIFDPTGARRDEAQDNPVIAELTRVGAHVGKVGRRRGESDTSYRNRQRTYGVVLERVLDAVIRSDQYRRMRPLAEVLVARDIRFSRRDPRDIAMELQRGIIEDAVRETRQKLTAKLRSR